ncbi:helix-turn-helix domain-containing protein [Actinoplanes sp. NPDC020271]|uniref:AraC family transcriptional regulator n=1 Tax=Actinoplanes sp. NPDC020271 TaxID=3363896 RepID=UPI003792DD26
MKTGHVIRQMVYQPPCEAWTPVETMTFARLRALNDGATQRADFHVLAFVRSGHGSVTADFATHPLGPRSAFWIGPGVVHRWTGIDTLTGDLVLFVPTVPVPPASEPWTAGAPAWHALDHLRYEFGLADRNTEVLRLLLSALLLRLDPPAGAPTAPDGTFQRFRLAVEEDFREHHDVGHYARRLGYSARTLSRSAYAATGRSAKDYLTERLLLEAKRLLVHDGLSPGACGRRLGFPDASNFSAFFLRGTGVRPGAFDPH